MFSILALLFFNFLPIIMAGTQIKVINNYRTEVNVKIQGSGVGGCDILLQSGEENDADCWCLWGTVNYAFCAYNKPLPGFNSTELESGRCPEVTGETKVCNDLSSLGNCYDSGYVCTIDTEGLCHCDY